MTIPMNTDSEAGRAVLEAERVARKAEIERGGELKDSLCPYCGRPRFDRSDYIRCGHCGMNWAKGYDTSKAPAVGWAAKDEAERKARS